MALNVNAIIASDGEVIPVESLAQTMNYTGSVLNYVQVVWNNGIYRQSYSYNGANLIGVSAWTKQ